jgi:hypothetical protein
MQEISNSMTRMDGERDFIKETVARICDEHELNKRVFRKLSRTYHKQNFSKEVAEHNEFESLYEELTGETTL